MNAVWQRLTWPVRIIRCSEAAAIEVMQIKTPTWCRNLSSVSQGQPRRMIAARIQVSRCGVVIDRVISDFRRSKDAPGAHDQEPDHHAEGQEGGGCRAIEGANKALGEAEQQTT